MVLLCKRMWYILGICWLKLPALCSMSLRIVLIDRELQVWLSATHFDSYVLCSKLWSHIPLRYLLLQWTTSGFGSLCLKCLAATRHGWTHAPHTSIPLPRPLLAATGAMLGSELSELLTFCRWTMHGDTTLKLSLGRRSIPPIQGHGSRCRPAGAAHTKQVAHCVHEPPRNAAGTKPGYETGKAAHPG